MKRKLTWAAAIIAAACCLLAAIYALRGVLIAPHLEALIRETVREQLGLEVSIGRVGGSLLADVEIRDVQTITPATATPVSSLALRRLSLRYSLVSLLKGLSGFVRSASLDAEGLQLQVDLDQGNDSPPDGHTVLHIPPALPALHIRDADVSLRNGKFRLQLKGMRLQTGKESPEGRAVRLRVGAGSWSHPRIRPGSGSLAADLRFVPDAIRIEELLLNGEPLIEQAYLGFTRWPDRLPFAARLRIGGGRLDLQGEVADSVLQSTLKAHEIQLAPVTDLFKLEGEGTLNLDAAVSLPLENPAEGMSGRMNLSLRNGTFRSIHEAELRVDAALGDGWLRLDTLELNAFRSHAAVTGAAVPWSDLLEARADRLLRALSAEFRLSSEDVPSLLILAGLLDKPAAKRIPDHRLVFAGRVEQGSLVISSADLTSGAGNVQLRDLQTSLPPAGRDTPLKADLRIHLPDLVEIASIFRLPPLGGSLDGALTVSGSIGHLVGRAELTGSGLLINGQPVGNGSLRATAEHETVRVESLSFRNGRDRLEAKGTVQLAEGRFEGAVVDFDVAAIEDYSRLFLPHAKRPAGLPPWIQGSFKGRARVSGPWGYPDGELAMDFENLQIRGRRFGTGSARITKRGDAIAADPLNCANGADRLDARGSFDFGTLRFGATRLDLHAADIGAYIKVFAPDWEWLNGKLSGRLEGSGPLREPEFSLEVLLERMQAGGLTLRDTAIKARGAERRIHIESAEARTVAGKVVLAGDIERSPSNGTIDLALADLAVSGEDLSLDLKAPARIRYASPGIFTVDGFLAGGPQGSVSAQGSLSLRGNSDLGVQLSGVSGAGWLSKLIGIPLALENLDASLRVQGAPPLPEITAAGTIQKIGIQDTALRYAGRFDLSYNDKRLHIQALDLSGPQGHRIALTGELPLDPAGPSVFAPGPLSVSGGVRVPDLQPILALRPAWPLASGSLEADLSLRGSWQAPTGTLTVRGRSLRPSDDIGFRPGLHEALCEASLTGGRLVLRTLRIEGPVARLQVRGEIDGLPSFPELIAGTLPPNRGQWALTGSLMMADLGWLARSLKDVRRTSGRLEARMTLEGPLHDPAMLADVHLSEGTLLPEADIPSLQALNLHARFTGRNLEIESLQGETGGAPFTLSGRLENIFTPLENGRADLQLEGENLLFYRSDALRLRANAKLALRGPISRMTLAGGIIITDGFYGKNFGLLEGLEAGTAKQVKSRGLELFSIESAPFRNTVFDVRITAAMPFQIKNNLVRGAVRPDLQLGGTGLNPTLAGKIYLEPSALYLPAGRMQLESGTVRFEPSEPARPRLDLIGTTRMLGYDITAVAEGPYDEPTITLSSVPPLPDQELLMLVLTGQAPKATGAKTSQRGQSLNVAVFFGRDMITRIEGGESTETLQTILERFDVEVGRFVTRSGDETINAEFRLADDVIQDGDTLYLTGEKDMFDYYNTGIKIVFRFR